MERNTNIEKDIFNDLKKGQSHILNGQLNLPLIEESNKVNNVNDKSYLNINNKRKSDSVLDHKDKKINSNTTASTSTSNSNSNSLLEEKKDESSLVPFMKDSQIILYNQNHGQVVLYNKMKNTLSVRRVRPKVLSI